MVGGDGVVVDVDNDAYVYTQRILHNTTLGVGLSSSGAATIGQTCDNWSSSQASGHVVNVAQGWGVSRDCDSRQHLLCISMPSSSPTPY
jgi:hypothetical protein